MLELLSTIKTGLNVKHVLQYLFDGFRSDFEFLLLLLTSSEASGDLFKWSIVNAHYRVTTYRVTSRTRRQKKKTIVLNVTSGNLVGRKRAENRTQQEN